MNDINYDEFNKRFPSEEECLNYLFRLRWADGYCCPKCNCKENWKISASKYKCRQCSYQTTVTTGTLFHNTRIDIRTWFRVIWLMSIPEYNATAAKLQKELKISGKAARTMVRKIWLMMDEKKINRKLKGKIDICIKESPNKSFSSRLLVAVEVENRKRGHVILYQMPDFTTEVYHKFVLDNIEPGSILGKATEGDSCKVTSDIEGYSIVMARENTYKASYADAVYKNFKKYYEKEKDNGKKLPELMAEYCWFQNASKETPDFETVLYNAVHYKPQIIE